MEGDVQHIMPRPLPASLLDPETDSFPDPSSLSEQELAGVDAQATSEERGELEKYIAWKDCEGLSKIEAKRRYIDMLIRTMHVYASGTAEARSLVEELEFVWEQVQGNSGPNGMGSRSGSGGSGRDRDRERDRRRNKMTGSEEGSAEDGLRRLRPMSEDGGAELEEKLRSIDDAVEGGGRMEGSPGKEGQEGNSSQWRQRIEKALVQMTAEVAALRELIDATSSQRRLWARSAKRGWVIWAWMALWKLVKRAAVDAAVVATVLVLLRWRYRERVEEWWESLGDFMGFVRKNVKQQIKKRDVASLLGR